MPNKLSADQLIRSISLLKALRSAISDLKEYNDITESHVNEFHEILKRISAMGIDLEEFFVSNSQIQRDIVSSIWDGSSVHHTYSEEKYVRKSILLTKLDGIINYLNAVLKEPERTLGYQLPK